MERTLENLEPLFGVPQEPGHPVLIAGPCSAESRDQVLSVAMALASQGIRYFRAGIWKPRTKPGCFEGVGTRGLPWLAEVREKTGLVPVTEIASSVHLKSALRSGINAFWIGARTAANPFAVQDIADGLASLSFEKKSNITILVKNPVNPDIDLWIGALERLYDAGIRRLGAIHRGFSAYGEHLYRNVPEWRIPIELFRRVHGLPVLCDPSHIGGRREFILPISQQAMDMNFNGLIIESHCDPSSALSDSAQQVTPEELSKIIGSLTLRKDTDNKECLRVFREEIDRIDDDLISLLARRMEVSREIGGLKLRENLPVIQRDRYNDLMARRVVDGRRLGLDEDFMRNILSAIHEESVRQQLSLGAQ